MLQAFFCSTLFATPLATVLATLLAAFGSLAISANAISASSLSANSFDAMEEIIVYSSLDNRELKDLAASIAIWDEREIRSRNAQHIDQLLNTVPNVNFSGGASRGRFVQVRGVGDIEQFVDPKAYPAVGLIVDGIDMSGLFGSGLLFDTGQVEIARGPQGTRLGASALAGSINIVSNRPTDNFASFVEAGFGKFAARQFGGAVSGALSGNARGRLALQQYRSDGYIDNAFLNRDDTGEFDELVAKSRLEWTFDDNKSAALTFLHIDNANGYDAFSLDNTRHRTYSDRPGRDEQRVSALAANFTQPVLKSSELQYKLTWLQADTLYSFDEDWASPDLCNPPASCGFGFFSSADSYDRDRKDYSIEIKLVDDAFVAGLFAQDREVELERNRVGDAALTLDSHYETERQALFGQWTPRFGDALQLSLGARLERFADNYVDSNAIASESDDELWAIDAGLKYAMSSQAQLFLLASRGNKAGGVNTDAITNQAAINASFRPELLDRLRYASESLSNYEIGVNGQSKDGKTSTNITVFYNLRNKPQFETFLYDNLSSFLFVGYQDNAKSAESHGVEMQASHRFNRTFSIDVSAAYIDASIKGFRVYDFDQQAYKNIANKEQPRAPRYQYHIAGNAALTNKLSATLALEGRDSYQFAYYFDRESGHSKLVHGNINYQHEHAEVTLWVRNIRDEDYPVQGLYFANNPVDPDTFSINKLYTQTGEPRNGGVTFRYNF